VSQGEAVGIIGRNGAGKSTLLKILSRITYPTSGQATIYGRVSSLLEVGTGFHPELSGRENVYLNGTILGMRRAEVKAKFDEIVEFSGVSKFIDTPIKHYSSGMKVRLAFAVAAHLEPEILIIDEVLAVGDAEFQKKCLGKMEEVAGQGRTVLFVSHNLAAVTHLCTEGVFLDHGRVRRKSEIRSCVNEYIACGYQLSEVRLFERKDREGEGNVRVTNIELMLGEQTVNVIQSGDDVRFRLTFKCQKPVKDNFRLDLGLDGPEGNRIAWFSTSLSNSNFSLNAVNDTIELKINRFPFNRGRYSLTIFLSLNDVTEDWIKDAFSFFVESGDFFKVGRTVAEAQGPFLVNHSFRLGL
jgi:lipopolysaccharide transport system ATP-binding protein